MCKCKCKWADMNQALRVVGQLHSGRDSTTFHEETFTCPKFFLVGPERSTTRLNLRHLSFRPGEVLRSTDLESLFHFLKFLRRVKPVERCRWLIPQDANSTRVRSFRWASRDSNVFVSVLVRGSRLLVVLSEDYESGRKWVEHELSNQKLLHTVSWF
jgi:hypothetical protein